MPGRQPLYQLLVPGLKLAKLARWTADWMLRHDWPGRSRVPSVVEIVISQFAWWPASGPHAGAKRVGVAITPVTWWTHEPAASVRQPPVLICATRLDALVSSAQSLIETLESATEVVPVFVTLKKSCTWLAPQELVNT